MSRRPFQQRFGTCFFVTTTFRDFAKYGEHPGVYDVLARSLTHCLNKYRPLLPAYVLMPSHLHLLIAIEGDRLGDYIRDFKKYTAQKGLRELGINEESTWQQRYDRVAVYSETVFRQKLEYIHNNPIRAGMVAQAHEWPWSSAGTYVSDEPGPIPVWREWQL